MTTPHRQFLKDAALASAAIGLATNAIATPKNNSSFDFASRFDPDAPQLLIGESIAVADTAKGRIKGFIMRNGNPNTPNLPHWP
ncbi:Tat pathway signal sequence domain protein [Verrucomicrobiia bacterium DG1235]|nr:Tat pathway signal sequence domain protein [Verrucomicrobiae bacterium DG1235]